MNQGHKQQMQYSRDSVPFNDDPPGFELLGLIDRGGSSQVFLAMQLSLERKVAIKMSMPFAGDSALTDPQRLLQEARMLASLKHDNILNVIDVFMWQERMCIVTDLLEGVTLEKLMRTQDLEELPEPLREMMAEPGRFTNDGLHEMVRQVCKALDHAHKKGIVHRDVKPSNIFVTNDGTFELFDFGIARVAGSGGMTEDGRTLGSPPYMSPEQIQKSPSDLDARSDIYSFGCVLYHCCTGELPFSDTTSIMVCFKHINEKPQPPRERCADVPEHVNEIILKCLEKDPADRFQSVSELLTALHSKAGTMSRASTMAMTRDVTIQSDKIDESPRVADEKPKSSRAMVFFLMILVFLGIVGIGGYLYIDMYKPELKEKIVAYVNENITGNDGNSGVTDVDPTVTPTVTPTPPPEGEGSGSVTGAGTSGTATPGSNERSSTPSKRATATPAPRSVKATYIQSILEDARREGRLLGHDAVLLEGHSWNMEKNSFTLDLSSKTDVGVQAVALEVLSGSLDLLYVSFGQQLSATNGRIDLKGASLYIDFQKSGESAGLVRYIPTKIIFPADKGITPASSIRDAVLPMPVAASSWDDSSTETQVAIASSETSPDSLPGQYRFLYPETAGEGTLGVGVLVGAHLKIDQMVAAPIASRTLSSEEKESAQQTGNVSERTVQSAWLYQGDHEDTTSRLDKMFADGISGYHTRIAADQQKRLVSYLDAGDNKDERRAEFLNQDGRIWDGQNPEAGAVLLREFIVTGVKQHLQTGAKDSTGFSNTFRFQGKLEFSRQGAVQYNIQDRISDLDNPRSESIKVCIIAAEGTQESLLKPLSENQAKYRRSLFGFGTTLTIKRGSAATPFTFTEPMVTDGYLYRETIRCEVPYVYAAYCYEGPLKETNADIQIDLQVLSEQLSPIFANWVSGNAN